MKSRKVVMLLCIVVICPFSLAQKTPKNSLPVPDPPPVFHITFRPGDQIAGVTASPVIFLPFECGGDGTVFINMAQPPDFTTRLLTSVSLSGEAHVFRMEQVPGLYDVQTLARYVSDSSVIFLVQAASEDRSGKLTTASPSGGQTEKVHNVAERHLFIVVLDREGRYQRKIELEDRFHVQQIGVFQSGMFLAFGFDESSHAPRLALLNDDGAILKYLQIEEGDAPESALSTEDPGGKGPAIYIKATQFVGEGHSIIIAQSKSEYPLLEVSESGAIRAIYPKLAKGDMINVLVPSDTGLYARVIGSGTQEPIYEISLQDGSILRRFDTDSQSTNADVACVHDHKFLSFEHGEGKLIPLIGTPAPVSNNDVQVNK